MFTLTPKPISRSERYTLEDVASQVAGGFASVHGFMHVIVSGDYSQGTPPTGDDVRDSNIFQIFSRFYRYVYEGTFNIEAVDEDVLDGVAFCLNARLNGELFTHAGGDLPVCLEHSVTSACARKKLDVALGYPTYDFEPMAGFIENADSDDLSLAEVALLAHMDIQSVRNASQATHADYLPTYREKGQQRLLVKAQDAANWLKGRNGFVARKQSSDEIKPGFVEVPFAADGSYFNTACRQRSGFNIGPKGREQYYETLDEALMALRKMPVAYWRRPNANGRYGVVKAVEWKVIAESDFRDVL